MKKTIFMLPFVLLSPSTLAGDIAVQDAWIQEAPPNVRTMAAYMSIENRSTQAVSLVSISSEDFEKVETHTTQMHHDMAHMEKHHGTHIAAGDTVVFSPGGHHLMLMGKKRSLHAGDTVMIRLHFSNGAIVTADVAVRRQNRE